MQTSSTARAWVLGSLVPAPSTPLRCRSLKSPEKAHADLARIEKAHADLVRIRRRTLTEVGIEKEFFVPETIPLEAGAAVVKKPRYFKLTLS